MSQTLAQDCLESAASKGATKWLQQFIRIYLAELHAGRLTPEAFANELEEEFASRGLNTSAQQKNYRSNVVQALKVLDLNHPAIALVALSTEEYRRLNDEQRERVADRETRFIHPEAVDTIVEIAENLLASDEWSDVGAGLAVLMGRRISEILLSEFAWKSPWSLSFSRMVKKADDLDVTIEIPTLAPAQPVLEAIERLQHSLAITDLKRSSTSPRQVRQAVNRRYSLAIAQKCDEYFSGLVPNRSDRDNLYTHLFRAVYATIAAHWFCPPTVPEHLFKAEIQGHFTLSQAGKKLPNYAARSNYDDYAIGDGQGNKDGRLGIKLGQLPELDVIEAFRDEPVDEAAPALEPDFSAMPDEKDAAGAQPTEVQIEVQVVDVETEEALMPQSQERPTKRPQVYADDLERLSKLMALEGVEGTTAEHFSALLDAYEAQREQPQHQQTETVHQVAQTFNWFTAEIETLRANVRSLQAECDQLKTQGAAPVPTENLKEHIAQLEQERDQLRAQQIDPDEFARLQARNAELVVELQETQSRLEGIHKLLGTPVSSAASAPSASTPETKAPDSKVKADPAEARTSTQQETKQREPRSEGLHQRSDSKTKVEAIVQDLINWNTAQPGNKTRLRISVSIIKALGSLVGATYQPVIMEVLEEQRHTIDEIHERFLLGARHNVRVDKDNVLQAIARDYMGVENWQDATYG
ncbi:protelomerase family protein [Oscillatoria sp. CS-180]|uniref:protelomerase family protein n=1 Tax=Oscillatoria sp. CS-180 TaxID=3021720 RepID=UPI00232E7CA8|nr:protelomerase family protein [Oscillatoria sp. CS-180]MDB9524824.1 protelomerase family protein [Oscillatoria sp. CS-180]